MPNKKNLKVKKATILGIGNDGNFNYIKIRKHKGIGEWLVKFFREGFNEFYTTSVETHIHKGKKTIYKSKKREIEDLVDCHESLTMGYKYIKGKTVKRPRIDIFYGKNTIFITTICTQQQRKKFVKILGEIGQVYKPRKK